MGLAEADVEKYLQENPLFLDSFIQKHISVETVQGWLEIKLKWDARMEEVSSRSSIADAIRTTASDVVEATVSSSESYDKNYKPLVESLFRSPHNEFDEGSTCHHATSNFYGPSNPLHLTTVRETNQDKLEKVSGKDTMVSTADDITSLVHISGSLASLVVSMVKGSYCVKEAKQSPVKWITPCPRGERTGLQHHVEVDSSGVSSKEYQSSVMNGPVCDTTDPDCLLKGNKGNIEKLSQVDSKTMRSFACSVCGKLFMSLKYLRNHRRTIHPPKGPKSYRNTKKSIIKNTAKSVTFKNSIDCAKELSSVIKDGEKLKIEFQEDTIKDKQTGMTSNQSSFVTSSRFAFKKLPARSKKSPNKLFRCDRKGCGKTYWSRTSLRRHQILHATYNPFVCTYCRFPFQTNADLKRHTYIHTGERPYHCDRCGRGFVQRSLLKKHIVVSHEIKNEQKLQTLSMTYEQGHESLDQDDGIQK